MIEKSKIYGFKYEQDSLEQDIKKGFELVGISKQLKRNDKIFVKPNYTTPFFKPGVTTTPQVLEATLSVLKEYASDVLVGEADGGDDSFTAEYSLKTHGLPEICKRTGATMINLSKVPSIRVVERINNKKVEVTLPKPLLNVDATLSVPVLKVHVATQISLTIKNLWGCHPSTLRLMDHKYLSERLTLIAKSINLKYGVIDAVYGLNIRGPMDGHTVAVNAIIVGNNPVAIDATGARLMGFDPEKIDHIRVAGDSGLGPYQLENIELLSDLSPYQQKFHVSPTMIDRASLLLFKSNILNKIVSDSVFTGPIYTICGRTARKKIVEPGDEV